MPLLLLSGSPRGKHSNTLKMLQALGRGWKALPQTASKPMADLASLEDRDIQMLHLTEPRDFQEALFRLPDAETVILGMPLYTDAMPAIVNAFIEAMAPHSGGLQSLRLGFLIQSGFMEALHSRPLEAYLAKLAKRLKCQYVGTIVRGGGERLQIPDSKSNRLLFANLEALGSSLASKGCFDPALLEKVADVERYSPLMAALLSLAVRLPILNKHWDQQLKKNGVWKQRDAKPYLT